MPLTLQPEPAGKGDAQKRRAMSLPFGGDTSCVKSGCFMRRNDHYSNHVHQIPDAIFLRRPRQVLRELKEHFVKLDEKGTGFLDFDQCIFLLRSLGFNPTESQVKECVRRADLSIKHAGLRMTYEEFVIVWDTYVRNDMVDLDDELVRLAFEALDLDGRGEVDMEEMITVLTNIGGQPLTRAEVEAFFGHIDENRSGAIDIEEFVQFLVKELIATEDMRVKFSQEIELNFGRGLGAVTSSVARRGTSTSQVAAGLMDMARRVKTIQSQRAPAKEEQVEASRKSFFGRKSRAEGGQRKSRGEGLGEGESRGIFGRKSRVEGAGAKDEAGDGEKMRRRRSRAMAGRAEEPPLSTPELRGDGAASTTGDPAAPGRERRKSRVRVAPEPAGLDAMGGKLMWMKLQGAVGAAVAADAEQSGVAGSGGPTSQSAHGARDEARKGIRFAETGKVASNGNGDRGEGAGGVRFFSDTGGEAPAGENPGEDGENVSTVPMLRTKSRFSRQRATGEEATPQQRPDFARVMWYGREALTPTGVGHHRTSKRGGMEGTAESGAGNPESLAGRPGRASLEGGASKPGRGNSEGGAWVTRMAAPLPQGPSPEGAMSGPHESEPEPDVARVNAMPPAEDVVLYAPRLVSQPPQALPSTLFPLQGSSAAQLPGMVAAEAPLPVPAVTAPTARGAAVTTVDKVPSARLLAQLSGRSRSAGQESASAQRARLRVLDDDAEPHSRPASVSGAEAADPVSAPDPDSLLTMSGLGADSGETVTSRAVDDRTLAAAKLGGVRAVGQVQSVPARVDGGVG